MRNIFLVSIDTFRFDCIGYQPDQKELHEYDVIKYLETPALDEIAGRSLCFTHCFSTNTYTTSAHASVFTGLYPPGHGIREFYRRKLDTSVFTLAEILKVYGYKTVMFTDTVHLFTPLELNRGFDFLIARNDAALFKLLAECRNNENTKNFIFVHFFDLHVPYLASEEDKYNDAEFMLTMEELYAKYSIPFERSIYSARDKYFVWQNFVHQAGTDVTALMPFYVQGIRKFDMGRFRNFVSFLKSHGYMDDSLFFFFSDHGEGRNDEANMYSFGHSGPVYDNVIRVPLMIYHKDVNHGVTDRMTSIVDIFPTVLEMATGERPHADFSYRIDGTYLLNDYRERPVYCETWLNDHKDKHWNLEMTSYLLYQRALRDRSRKYVVYGVPEKFQDGNYEGSDEDFLRDYYRGYRYRFESYNEFVEELKILNKDPSTRAQMLGKVDARFLCYFDLATDPDELTPIFVDSALNSGNGNPFQTLLSISSRSSEAPNIFDEIESTYLEDIAGKLLAIDQKTTIRCLAQNKHLLNEMIDRILLDSRLSNREFIMLIHEIFLRRTPTEREIDEGEELIRQGVTRRRYFNNVIFNNRVFGNLKTFAAAKTELHDLLELSEYKRKYEEIQESLIFRCFRKTAFLIDNVLFPQYTRRRTLLMHVLKKFRTDK